MNRIWIVVKLSWLLRTDLNSFLGYSIRMYTQWDLYNNHLPIRDWPWGTSIKGVWWLSIARLFFVVDWESCDEEEAELDDADKTKARRWEHYKHQIILYLRSTCNCVYLANWAVKLEIAKLIFSTLILLLIRECDVAYVSKTFISSKWWPHITEINTH